MKQYGKSAIVMVIVDKDLNLVNKEGQPIPEGEELLDNAIYQTMPENFDSKFYADGSMKHNCSSVKKQK